MSETVIAAEGLGKRYELGSGRRGPRFSTSPAWSRLGRALRLPEAPRAPRSDVFWALQDVSFHVHAGEILGVIGMNGAGKSSLLKILSGITTPTRGSAAIDGRVGTLLEVGTGFHPELTGRENVYLNGAILGMSRREIAGKFDEIVEFSGLDRFLDTPVKRYSSGMFVRLAFAVAAHLDTEILILDEVLAVGDAAFQQKCFGKVSEATQSGRTILFVSHSMPAVENLCSRVLVLDSGRLVFDGPAAGGVAVYNEGIIGAATSAPLSERRDRSGSGAVRLTGFHVEDPKGGRVSRPRSGQDLVWVFEYESHLRPGASVDIGFSVHSVSGQLLFVIYSSYTGGAFVSVPEAGQFRCTTSRLPLPAGRYTIGARVVVDHDEADWPTGSIAVIDVEPGDFYSTGSSGFGDQASFLVDGTWRAVGKSFGEEPVAGQEAAAR